MKVFDLNTFVERKAFEGMLASNSFYCSSQELRKIEYFTTRMINKQCTARVPVLFPTKGSIQSTIDRREIMICGNTVSGSNVILFQNCSAFTVKLSMKSEHVIWVSSW